MLRWILVFFALLAVPTARSDPHRQPHRPTPAPSATPTLAPAITATVGIPVTGSTAQPEGDHGEAATPDRSTWPCQICIDVSGTPQWPSACHATQYAGGSCAPTETATPDPYP